VLQFNILHKDSLSYLYLSKPTLQQQQQSNFQQSHQNGFELLTMYLKQRLRNDFRANFSTTAIRTTAI
jgi:hypothetical protein